MAEEFNYSLRVYIEDTDAGGIVYYVNYLKFMERARTEYLRELGVDHAEMIKQGVMFVINSAAIDYRAPAYLDDSLLVQTRIDKLTRVSMSFVQSIRHQGSNKLLAEAEVKGACVDMKTMKPCRMPAKLAENLLSS